MCGPAALRLAAPVTADTPYGRILRPPQAVTIFAFCPFFGTDSISGFSVLGCLVRAHEHGGALVTGPPLATGGPEPGRSQGSQCRCTRLRPQAGTAIRAAPCGAAILQHHLFTASALAVNVPPRRWLRPGSRGDSLHGLVHTSPYAATRCLAAVRAQCHGSHSTRYMYTVPPALGPGQLQKKTAVVVAHNSCPGTGALFKRRLQPST